LDETRKTSDSRITAVFQVTNVSSRSERHPWESENRCIWMIYLSVTLIPSN